MPAGEPDAEVRRLDLGEIVKPLVLSVALVGYVYLAGWLVTWIRLAAARLPADAALPMIADKVLFAAGVRMVVAMTLVFGVMCVLAYYVHAWTWNKRAPEWHSIVKQGRKRAHDDAELPPLGQKLKSLKPSTQRRARRRQARATRAKLRRAKPVRARLKDAVGLAGSKLKPQSAPEDLQPAAMGDRFVRVVAGFNVGVLSVVIGLAGGRLLKTVVDQISPGHWWALLGPWALISLVLAVVLTNVRPVRGGSFVHGFGWVGVVAVAMFTSAPIGLLVLTWAGIATFGRRLGRSLSRPQRKVDFVLSPLPWVLLGIYALVALSFSAMPPVSFSQTTLQTARGTRLAGYLARNGSGVYVVSCTPLADATSTAEAVSFLPHTQITSVSSGEASFSVDSGYRPSLPTLALHAVGVAGHTPTWIKPELRSRRATCAGAPQPRPRGGSEQPQLGGAAFAGPAPSGGSANDGE